MELRRATYKDQTAEMDLGFLPDGSAPYFSSGIPVEGEPGVTADLVVTGAEDGENVYVYAQFYRDGEMVEGWSREFPEVRSALRIVGFLSSPLSRADLSLLSFSRGY